jgi:hypothetical protein
MTVVSGPVLLGRITTSPDRLSPCMNAPTTGSTKPRYSRANPLAAWTGSLYRVESVTNGHTAVSVADDVGRVVDFEVVDVADPGPMVVVVWLDEDDLDPHPITPNESANTVAANASCRCLLIP